MNDAHAANEAARIFPLMLARCRIMEVEFAPPVELPLAIYETDHDIHTLRPEDGGVWCAAFHREVMTILAGMLEDEGFVVPLVMRDAAAYFRWLAAEALTDSAENRAAFIARPT